MGVRVRGGGGRGCTCPSPFGQKGGTCVFYLSEIFGQIINPTPSPNPSPHTSIRNRSAGLVVVHLIRTNSLVGWLLLSSCFKRLSDTHAHTHTRTQTNLYTHTLFNEEWFIHTYIHTYIHTNMWGQKGFNPLCQCVYVYVCIVKPDIQTIHICSHTSIHTHTHTHTQPLENIQQTSH